MPVHALGRILEVAYSSMEEIESYLSCFAGQFAGMESQVEVENGAAAVAGGRLEVEEAHLC